MELEDLLADRRIRFSAALAFAVLWVAVAWADVSVLLLLLIPAAVVWFARRHPQEPHEADEADDFH